jgi:hypothetical protein
MRKLFVAAATVAIFALLVTPAFAKPGNGGGKGKPGGQVAAVESSITLNESNPSFGDVVTFTVSYPPMRDPALVRIWCWQGGVGVYHVAGVATDPFPLGGAQWTDGAAVCTADLYYYEWQGMTQTGPFYLANTTFDVAA